jgi:iron complex transport system ATP-binding protein
MAAMLETQELTVRYGDLTVLDKLSFTLEPGEWLMIVGPNGAGKSTAISAITQSAPYTGTVSFEGADVRSKKPAELARCMGVLMQKHSAEYAFTVEEVVALGRYCHSSGFLAGRGGHDTEAVEAALELTGLLPLRAQSVLTLSGGELQRTFLAQVFAQEPRLLLLDEPTNHLDLIYQKQIFGLISDWLKQPGRAVLSVVHDLSLARAYGTRALLLDRGKTVAAGPVTEVLSPANLDPVYGMDVAAWMRTMLSQWN